MKIKGVNGVDSSNAFDNSSWGGHAYRVPKTLCTYTRQPACNSLALLEPCTNQHVRDVHLFISELITMLAMLKEFKYMLAAPTNG